MPCLLLSMLRLVFGSPGAAYSIGSTTPNLWRYRRLSNQKGELAAWYPPAILQPCKPLVHSYPTLDPYALRHSISKIVGQLPSTLVIGASSCAILDVLY